MAEFNIDWERVVHAVVAELDYDWSKQLYEETAEEPDLVADRLAGLVMAAKQAAGDG